MSPILVNLCLVIMTQCDRLAGEEGHFSEDKNSILSNLLARVVTLEQTCANDSSSISKLNNDLQIIKAEQMYGMQNVENETNIEEVDRHKRSTYTWNDTDQVTGPVAFFALLTNTLSHVAVQQTIVFDSIVTNVGDCYSRFTGVFTCCKTGLYMFSWNIQVPGGHFVKTDLMVNKTVIARNYAGDNSYESAGSMTAIIELEPKDEVFIRIQSLNSGSYIYTNKATSFTGISLQ